MNVNIIMWIGGMGAVLAAFAFKLAIGFSSGRPRPRWIVTILAGYLGLFALAGLLSGKSTKVLELLLQQGPYLHGALAGGMILWGLWLAGRKRRVLREAGHGGGSLPLPAPVLPFVLPCPVCLAAMAFSVCAAGAALRLPPLVVGLCLGGAFVLASLAVLFLLRRRRAAEASATPLGLAMTVIGLYFVLSLAIPAKIEEAKGMYASFLLEHQTIDIQNTLGALGILAAMVLIGYWAGKHR